MIFEFLKRLFWKADEGNRKRKASEISVKSSQDQFCAKKCRYDFVSSNHVKIMNKPDNDSYYEYNTLTFRSPVRSSLNSTNFKIQMENNKKHESLATTSLGLPSVKVNIPDVDNCIVKKELMNQFTLYDTLKLCEKKKYSNMLTNFIAFGTENTEELHNMVNDKDQSENLDQSSFENEYVKSPKFWSQTNHKSSIFHNPQNCMKTQSQKCISLNDIDLEQKYEIKTQKCKLVNSIIRTPPIEVIKTNTLRDRLSSNQIIKKNFISQVSEKYDERIKQHYKEAEELKKLTSILSKHNQLSREIALEDHLNRSMHLCEAVLDERLSEVKSKLPELSLDMKERIKFALSLGSPDEILVEGFGLRITRKDIQTLAGLNWLNDEVINFYMNLLMIRSNNERYPSIYAMNTFFYPKLISGGHSSLKRWTRKVDIFAKDLIVIPIHLGVHWCMSIIDFRSKSIQYFDSMGSPNYKCLQLLKQYLHEESIDKKKQSFDFLDWSFECIKDIPQQMNGSDCGVFSCMFAEYICSNKQINFCQEDMPYFRNKMVYEILTTQLL